MTQLEKDSSVLEQGCGEVIDRLLKRYSWQLLERDELIRRTHTYIQAGISADLRAAATYAYSQALYSACSGNEGVQRQNLGYTELFRYLYSSASKRYPDICDDATQHALEHTFVAFERCRQPGTFIAFAFQQLLDAVKAVRRHDQQRQRSFSHEVLDTLPQPRWQTDLYGVVVAGELRLRFEQLSAEFLQKYPRASQQLATLRMKYIDGLDEVTISQRLGKPIASVYVLRSRAIKKLRGDPTWRALAVDFGIFSDTHPE